MPGYSVVIHVLVHQWTKVFVDGVDNALLSSPLFETFYFSV